VFTYIYYSLLIEKDSGDRQSISNKFLCVPFLWKSLQFLVRVFPFLSHILCYLYFGSFLSIRFRFLFNYIKYSFPFPIFFSIFHFIYMFSIYLLIPFYVKILFIYIMLIDSLHYATSSLTQVFSRSFLVSWVSWQFLTIPVELAVMGLVFWLIVVGIVEVLIWLACVIVPKSMWVL
jgi:hypothetical protein